MKIDCEFRKGIFFVRLSGHFDKDNYQKNITKLNNLIEEIGIKNIVLNINDIKSIDIYGINYIIGYYNYVKNKRGSFILCEKDNCISGNLLKNRIPSIDTEIKAFSII